MRAPTWKGHVMFLYGTWHYTQAGVVGTGDSPRAAYGNWIAAQKNSYNSAYSNRAAPLRMPMQFLGMVD